MRPTLLLLGISLILSNSAQAQRSLVLRQRVPGGNTQSFSFSVTTPGAAPVSVSLADNYNNLQAQEVGVGPDGTIAVRTTNATSNKTYAVANGSSTWVDQNVARLRLDVGAGGRIWSIDGGSNLYRGSTQIPGAWGDVGTVGDGVVWAVTSTGAPHTIDTATLAATAVPGATGTRIDGGTGGVAVLLGTGSTVRTYNNSTWISLPTVSVGGTNVNVVDVSLAPDGTVWIVGSAAGLGRTLRYSLPLTPGAAMTGGTWVEDALAPTGQVLHNVSVGPDNQPIVVGSFANSGSTLPPFNLFKRLTDGSYTTIDVDLAGSTAVFYNLPVGTVGVTATVPAGWRLADFFQRGAASGSVTNEIQGTASVQFGASTAAVLDVLYAQLSCASPALPAAVGVTCGTGFLEDFGTGATPFGPAIFCDQTTQIMDPNLNSGGAEDGEYRIVSNAVNGGNGAWQSGPDHTTGDGTGNMMLINADYTPGVFFNRIFRGLIPGARYDFGIWAANIIKSGTFIPSNLSLQIIRPSTGEILASASTGPMPNSSTNGTLAWQQTTVSFTAVDTVVKLKVVNNAPGGSGNDLVLDDITFSISTDRGDAPETYGTSSAANGPCHVITPLVRLGALLDGNFAGTPSVNALADDNDRDDDEDGVTVLPIINTNTTFCTASLSVTNNTTSPATVVGWIDFNRNGGFESTEAATAVVAAGTTSGTVTLNWSNFTVASGSFTYARFRISTGTLSASTPTGTLADGEVEDYQIVYSTPPLSAENVSFSAVRSGNAVVLSWSGAEEDGVARYEVQRSSNAANWTSIVTTAPNGSSSYTAHDEAPLNGTAYYRLALRNADGTVDFSAVQRVVTSGSAVEFSISPNPARDVLRIEGQLTPRMSAVLYDGMGRTVRTVQYAGNGSAFTVPVADLMSGFYIVRLVDGAGQVVGNYRIAKQ